MSVAKRSADGWLGGVALAGLLVGSLGGCASDPRRGYSFESPWPAGVRSVAVPIFENTTYDAGVETELTEAVIKEFQRVSGIRVVQSGPADSTLRAVVVGSDLRRLSVERTTGLTQELGVVLTLDFDWKDNRTGKVITSRRAFAGSDTFVSALPTGERIETGRHAAAQRLAKDLVAELRAEW